MASPRGWSIWEMVLETVAAYHNQQRMRRKLRKILIFVVAHFLLLYSRLLSFLFF